MIDASRHLIKPDVLHLGLHLLSFEHFEKTYAAEHLLARPCVVSLLPLLRHLFSYLLFVSLQPAQHYLLVAWLCGRELVLLLTVLCPLLCLLHLLSIGLQLLQPLLLLAEIQAP